MDKKLRIAFLSRYQGKVERGAETYVEELSKRLSRKYDVQIFSGKDSDDFGKIISGNFDIVIPVNGRLQALKVSIGRLWGKYKTIVSGQAGVGKDDIWNILVTRPNAYVALTNFELNWAKKFSVGLRVVKIANGVDLEKFTPDGPRKKIDLDNQIVLSVGALYWYKHHERTIEALSNAKNVSLLIIGDGPEKEKLQNLGENVLGRDRFRIIKVPFEEIQSYYRSVDLFVLPSWEREAFGTVYVEALASGLPVVAPNDPPRREIVGDAGIFVDVSNSQEYAKSIEEALQKNWEDKPRRQAKKFSWDKIAEQYEELFKSL